MEEDNEEVGKEVEEERACLGSASSLIGVLDLVLTEVTFDDELVVQTGD